MATIINNTDTTLSVDAQQAVRNAAADCDTSKVMYCYKQVAYNPSFLGSVFVLEYEQTDEQTDYSGEEYIGKILVRKVSDNEPITPPTSDLPKVGDVFFAGSEGHKYTRYQ